VADEISGGKNRKAKEAAGGSSSAFRGSGNTLGSEDDPAPGSSTGAAAGGPAVGAVSSSTIDNMLNSIFGGRQMPPPPEEEQEVQTRNLTFWQDGFSVEDGPLYRYDDPKNKDLLEAIKAGHAPREIFDVVYNQPIEIVVAQRTNEPYVTPPKITKPFEGGGNRLGSAAPEISGSGSGSSTGGPSGSTVAGQTAEPSSFEVDTSKPTTSIQLRLGDGTK
jgi:UBX domain-containing protein 1